MIGWAVAGMPRPVGSEFRQRRIMAESDRPGFDGRRDVIPWTVSVVETVGGVAMEARRFHAHAAIVATDLDGHTMSLQDVVAKTKTALADPAVKWSTVTVLACIVDGCDDPLPLWAHDPAGRGRRLANDSGECMPCRMRTVLACRECGMPDGGHWVDPVRRTVLEQDLCHGCMFWTERAEKGVEIVTGDGMMYSVGRAGVSPADCRGFGGRRFRVSFTSGEVVETDNLWSGGQVPAWFMDRLRPNAIVEAI